MNNGDVELVLQVEKETNKSLLVSNGDKEPVWLPKSQIDWELFSEIGEEVTFFIPEWLAIKKELV